MRAQTRRDAEARLIKLACSDPPEGCARWTLHLLADELVTLDEIDFESISHETVRRRLKKHPQTTSLRLLGDSR
ncbi:helix-turn-helix domain-containing protein [Halococcus morrhuae]|uniref:helix-turn-helix domain-containing protein n=1 Tax=Halococcus morrhuae TaxID=2250 RepID=UPI00373AE283